MPKIKKSQSFWYQDWIRRINGELIYSTNGTIIFCHACVQNVPSAKFFLLNQHNQTMKHRLNLERYTKECAGNNKIFEDNRNSFGHTDEQNNVMDEFSKIIFLQLVFQRKELLFDNFYGRQSWEVKDKMWKQIFDECVEAGCRGLVDAEHLRKVTWQNLQRRSKEKYDKSKKAGDGAVKFNKIDELVLSIISQESDKLNDTDINDTNQQQMFDDEFGEDVNVVTKEETISNPPSPINPSTSLSSVEKSKRKNQKSNELSDELEDLKKRKIYAEIVKLEAETRLINAQAELKELELEEKKLQFFNRQ